MLLYANGRRFERFFRRILPPAYSYALARIHSLRSRMMRRVGARPPGRWAHITPEVLVRCLQGSRIYNSEFKVAIQA